MKKSTEDWFVGRMEEQSVVSKQSTSQSKGSVARLAEESKRIEELQKMDTLLKEKLELERRVKMMELELLHEREEFCKRRNCEISIKESPHS